jgi:predicted TIM-barrel fold metal-dependent hydrolase
MVARRVGPVIDSNVHLWDQGRNPVFWLEDRTMLRDMLGDYDSLPDTYTLADYNDATSGFDVRGVVWSDAGATDPVAAAEWVTAQNTARRVIGLVALGDPVDPGFERLVSALRANALVTSVRVRLVPALQTGAPAAPADADGRLTDGLRLLADQGLVATIEAGASEIGRVADLARRFPRLRVVLDHFGWPDDLSDAGRRAHLALLQRVADEPNVAGSHRCNRHDLPRVGHGHAPALAPRRCRGVRGRALHARFGPADRDAAVELWRLVRRVRRYLRLVVRGRPAAAVRRLGAAPLRRRHASLKQLDLNSTTSERERHDTRALVGRCKGPRLAVPARRGSGC